MKDPFELYDKSLNGKYEFLRESFQNIYGPYHYILSKKLPIERNSILTNGRYNLIKKISKKEYQALKEIPDNQEFLFNMVEMDNTVFYTHKNLVQAKDLLLCELHEVVHSILNHAVYMILYFPDIDQYTFSCTYFKKHNNDSEMIFNSFDMLQMVKNISYEEFVNYVKKIK